MTNYNFFDIIRTIRGDKKMSNSELATKVFHCSISFLSMIKKGDRRIPSEFFDKIMLAFPSTSIANQVMLKDSIKNMQEAFDRKHNRAIEMKQKEIITLVERLSFWKEQLTDIEKISDLAGQIITKVEELRDIKT